MGTAPAVVFIARHGARLDAQDSQWSGSSATPYDSPLSYGGWTQTRALGARIGSLLHARDISMNEDDTRLDDQLSSPKSRRRKHKVVIHTSPFLRCVQSSIALSAGMAQYHGNMAKLEAQKEATQSKPKFVSRHSRTNSTDTKTSNSMHGGLAVTADISCPADVSEKQSIQRNTLRIDAFLGEWLCPDYYEFITAPPPSNMMVAAAKAELLRSAEPVSDSRETPKNKFTTFFPDAWRQHTDVASTKPSLSMEDVAQVLPRLGKSSVMSSPENETSSLPASLPETPPTQTHVASGYTPPSPSYALSPSEPIPTGYVAHARDACINIDFQWDSMKDPQNWGDGGEHGEEWSSMHMRFRKGLLNMISWYKEKGADYNPQDAATSEKVGKVVDEEIDTILIIVTHGAGCNALIGALTGQPVLIDVGMASLTMAVRKERTIAEALRPLSHGYSSRRRRSSINSGLSKDYDMKLVASTDHLRAGADPLTIPQLESPKLMPAIPEYRARNGSTTSSGAASLKAEPFPPHMYAKNSALGSIRKFRAATNSLPSKSYTAGALTPYSTCSNGLWGSEREADLTNRSPSPGWDMTLNFDGTSEHQLSENVVRVSSSIWTPELSAKKEGEKIKQGLWGGPVKNPVRRWTTHKLD